MDSWQEMQLQLLLETGSESEFFTALKAAAADLGFDKCAYGMRAPLPITEPKIVMLNNYSADWQARYAQRNYLAVDPTVAHGMKSVLPIVWSDNLFSTCREFWEEARAHDLNVGWAQACYDARGIGGLLTLARADDDLTASELRAKSMKMTWLTQVAHEGLSRILLKKLLPTTEVTLTKREAEVMRWTADGKTSGEIAAIMNVSESTVNFHINNAISKLGATNKTAAAIKAIMLRLL